MSCLLVTDLVYTSGGDTFRKGGEEIFGTALLALFRISELLQDVSLLRCGRESGSDRSRVWIGVVLGSE